MKKKILMILIASFVFPLSVMASNITSQMTLDNTDLSSNKPIKVTIRLDGENLDDMYIFQTRLEFDENTFDVSKDSFKGYNGWTDIEYNPVTHGLIIINKNGATLNKNIVSFEVSLDKKASPSKKSIGLSNTIIANTKEDIEIKNISKTVNVNVASGSISNKVLPSNLGQQMNVGNVKLYYVLALVVLELVVAIMLLMIYYAAVPKLEKQTSKRRLATALSLIELTAISAFFGVNLVKGDLNGDRSINGEDVKVLQKHLVNSEMMASFKLEKADLNGDGKLSPSDLAILANKSFTKTVYTVNLEDAVLEENGYEKGSNIEIKFIANVTDDEEIDAVLINHKKYKVKKNDNNEYSIKVETASVSKKYNYNINRVYLTNGREVETNYDTSVVVLKDVPEISNVAMKEDVEHSKMVVALTLQDNDDAITNASYELVNEKGSVIEKGSLNKGKNSLQLTLENAVSYKLNIKVQYNRGSASGQYVGIVEDSYDLKLITDYRFMISHLNLVQNGTVTKNLEKKGNTLLTFTSTNVSGYMPKRITINNVEYVVTNTSENQYKVNLPNTIYNNNRLNISKVTLSNGKVVSIDETVEYNIIKDKPSVQGISTDEDVNAQTLKVGVSVLDNENTISDMIVRLYDQDGNFINEQHGRNVVLSTSIANKYIIKVFANYDRGYGYVLNEQLLFETTIDAKIKAKIINATLNQYYPIKNSVVDIDYVITSNHNTEVSKIIVNNIIYDAVKVDKDTYRISVNAGDIAGIKNYNVEKVLFSNELEYNINNEVKVDVLKDIPVVSNYAVEENMEDNKVILTFDLFDTNGAFNKGLIKLVNKETLEEIQSKEVIPGKNTITFDVQEGIMYSISVDIDASLDTKELSSDSPNVLTNYNIFTTDYTFVDGYKIDIKNISVLNSKGEVTSYFEKNELMSVNLTLFNNTMLEPISIKVSGEFYKLTKNDDGTYRFDIATGDVAGIETLEFESIALSNYKEIFINGEFKVEVLKSLPDVYTDIYSSDDGTVLDIELDDKDKVLTNHKVVVKNELGVVLFEGTVNEPIIVNSNEKLFNIVITGSYDLDSNIIEEDKNSYEDIEFYNKTIHLADDMVKLDDFVEIEFILDLSVGPISKVSLEDLGKVQVVLNTAETSETVNIRRYVVKDDQVIIHLDKDVLFIDDGVISNTIKFTRNIVDNNVKLILE